jgi:hypothetical protein
MENKMFWLIILVMAIMGIGGAFVQHSDNQVKIAKINAERCK